MQRYFFLHLVVSLANSLGTLTAYARAYRVHGTVSGKSERVRSCTVCGGRVCFCLAVRTSRATESRAHKKSHRERRGRGEKRGGECAAHAEEDVLSPRNVPSFESPEGPSTGNWRRTVRSSLSSASYSCCRPQHRTWLSCQRHYRPVCARARLSPLPGRGCRSPAAAVKHRACFVLAVKESFLCSAGDRPEAVRVCGLFAARSRVDDDV